MNTPAEERLEALDKIMSALAHPARRQILMAVYFRGEAVSAGQIAARFAHTWPTTTRHIRVLEEAGLLRQHRAGRTRLYSADPARLDVLRGWLDWFGQSRRRACH